MDQNTGKRCVQQGKHRNTMSEHGTGTGTRIRTGTGTGTKLEMVILRMVLVIPKFERRTEFRESQESVRSFDSSASRADEFRGGTSARGVTGLGLAKICQQSHLSVTGHNSIPPSRISSRDPEERMSNGELTGCHAQQWGSKQRLKVQKMNGEVQNED